MPHVTQAEAGVLVEAVRERARYFVLLRERMEETRRKDDALYPAVVAAHEALHSLWVRLHYRACGVDRPAPSAVESPLLDLPGAGPEDAGIPPHVVQDGVERPAGGQAVAERRPEDADGGGLVGPAVVPEPAGQGEPPGPVIRGGSDGG